jgi:hypothetical protein
MSMRWLPILCLFATLSAGAQTIGQNKPSDGGQTATLSVRSELVVETVVVKDKQGKPIEGLTANDFTLTEDGVPQKIRYCERKTRTSRSISASHEPRSRLRHRGWPVTRTSVC